MTIVDAAAIATPSLLVAGSVLRATAKLTRLADAVERLERAMGRVMARLEEHEHRITKGGL
ncbi:MAG TPA: hypothetical protein VMV92_07775 [Streptosporangiaceae bacterium]|nr:hypothetical protein [Streptosporangiaceae bacterium]